MEALGFGLGLRVPHYDALLASQRPQVDWLEAVTENFLVPGGRPRHILRRLRAQYPIVLHGVSMSLGSIDPLDTDYLRAVKHLADEIDAAWVSDHLCWTGIDGVNLHDLLPLPYTEETLRHVSDRVLRAQDILGRTLVIENVSSYVQFTQDEMSECAFLGALCTRTGCRLLLDVNNVYVGSVNHGFDAQAYLAALPADRVQQLHLAGHQRHGSMLIDTHDAPIAAPVWSLYERAVQRFGAHSVMIERDDAIPPLEELALELDRARAIAALMAEAA